MSKELKIALICGIVLSVFILIIFIGYPLYLNLKANVAISSSVDKNAHVYNSQLEQYKGEKITSYDVKELLELVFNSDIFNITINGKTLTNNLYNNYLSAIKNDTYYTVDFEYNSSDYIYNIIIKTYSE